MATALFAATVAAASSPVDSFFERLARSRDRVLLLDYDGTIAPFSVQRNRAFPYPTVPELLDCIMSTCRTRVELITGRMAREVAQLLGLNPPPAIWGCHGMERLRENGRSQVAAIPEPAQRALAEAGLGLQKEGLEPLTESKPGAVAVHWRGLSLDHRERVKAAAYRALLPLAQPQSSLALAEFDGGLELRLCACGKGDVARMVLSEHGPDAAVAYLGDDATDEDAFRAVNARGLSVLVRPTYRFTAAHAWIRPPEDLVRFLTDWVYACGGDM